MANNPFLGLSCRTVILVECVSCGKPVLGLAHVGLLPTFLQCTSMGRMPALSVLSSGWGQTTCTCLAEILSIDGAVWKDFNCQVSLSPGSSLSLWHWARMLGCWMHSCQGLPKVGRTNEPEKVPAGESHPFSYPQPTVCYYCVLIIPHGCYRLPPC